MPEIENEYIVLEKSEQYDFSGNYVWDNPDENRKEKFIADATEIIPDMLKRQSEEFKRYIENNNKADLRST